MKLTPRFKPAYNFKEALATLSFSNGNILKFEQAFSKKFECDYGVMFSYGRTGLYALFKCWELENVEIICPAYTCVVVPHAIVLSGNTPVFVDCAKGSFNMDIDQMESSITSKTRVIVVTHLFGYPMNVHLIDALVKRAEEKYGHKIYVVQDCAHSFGCRWEGELVTKYGDAAIFGLNISKIINTIFGGMVITKSKETQEKLLEFRSEKIKVASWTKFWNRFIYFWSIMFAFNSWFYGFVHLCERKGFLNRFVKYYDEETIDFPKDWDVMPIELEARVGLVQLSKYDEIIHRKQLNSLQVQNSLKNNDIQFLPHVDGSTYSHNVGLVKNREAWMQVYYKKGIQLGDLIAYVVPYMNSYKTKSGDLFPISEYYYTKTINYPNWMKI